MKEITIKYVINEPEDENNFHYHMQGDEATFALQDIAEYLREIRKYGTDNMVDIHTIEEYFYSVIRNRNIKLM